MVASAFTAPHASTSLTVDVTPTLELLDELQADRALEGHRITILTLVAKAVTIARRPQPVAQRALGRGRGGDRPVRLRATWASPRRRPRGLLVPTIKDADRLRLPELADAIGALTEAARAGTTTPGGPGRRHDHDHQHRGVRRRHRHADPGARAGGDPGDGRDPASAVGVPGPDRAAQRDDAEPVVRPPAGRRCARPRGSSPTSARSSRAPAPCWPWSEAPTSSAAADLVRRDGRGRRGLTSWVVVVGRPARGVQAGHRHGRQHADDDAERGERGDLRDAGPDAVRPVQDELDADERRGWRPARSRGGPGG